MLIMTYNSAVIRVVSRSDDVRNQDSRQFTIDNLRNASMTYNHARGPVFENRENSSASERFL